MKKLFGSIFGLLFLFSLSCCGNSDSQVGPQGEKGEPGNTPVVTIGIMGIGLLME